MKTKITLLLFVLSHYMHSQYGAILQMVHNSADTSVSQLKVWINDSVWAPQLSYLNCTAEHPVSPGVYTIGVSAISATSPSMAYVQSTVQLNSTTKNFFAIIGIHSSGPQYNPGSTQRPLTIFTRSVGPVGLPFMLQTGVTFYHLSTDSPSMTVLSNNDTIGYYVNYTSWQHSLIMAGARTVSISSPSSAVGTGSYNFPGGVNINLISTGFTNTLTNGRSMAAAGGQPFNLYIVPAAGGALEPFDFTLGEPTGFSDNSRIDQQLSVYPSPAKNHLTIECLNCMPEVEVIVSDITGQLVLTRSNHSMANLLDISSLKKGLYIFTIRSGQEIAQRRLLVE